MQFSMAFGLSQEMLALKLAIPESPQTGWDEAYEDFILRLRATKAKKTVAYYVDRLALLLRWAKEQKLTLQDFSGRSMSKYLDMRASTPKIHGGAVSDRTRRHDAVCAKVFFRFCFEEGMIERDPIKDYKVPRPTQRRVGCPTKAEVTELIRSVRRRWDADRTPEARFTPPKRRKYLTVRNVAIIGGLIDTGARISEILNLKLADYHPQDRYVVFRDTKTNEDREVPISTEWIGMIAEWMKVRPKDCACQNLFVTEYAEEIDPVCFGHFFRQQLKWAGLSGFTLHGLRHYAATKIAERGILAAKEILGHKSISTTQIYTHASRDYVRQIHGETAALAGVLSDEEKPIIVNKRTEQQKEKRKRVC